MSTTVSRVGGPHTSAGPCPCCQNAPTNDCVKCAGCCWSDELTLRITPEYSTIADTDVNITAGTLDPADVADWWNTDTGSPYAGSGTPQDFPPTTYTFSCDETDMAHWDLGGPSITFTGSGWQFDLGGGMPTAHIEMIVPTLGNCCGVTRVACTFHWYGGTILNGNGGDFTASVEGYITIEVLNNVCCVNGDDTCSKVDGCFGGGDGTCPVPPP